MRSIDPQLNSAKDNHKLMIGSIIPRPIAFVTSLGADGTLNGAPFSFFNIVSSNPPMISLSIQRLEGQQKDTARNILLGQAFVVHIVDEHNVAAINETAAHYPPDQSEVKIADLTPVDSIRIAVPGVKEAKVRMECKLVKALELGTDQHISCDLLIGEVVLFHIEDHIYEYGKIDARGLAAVSRLAGADYAKLGEIFTIKRPE